MTRPRFFMNGNMRYQPDCRSTGHDVRMDLFGDFFGGLLDGPYGLIGRRWTKRYRAGDKVFVRGFVAGLSEASPRAGYLVAFEGRLWVTSNRGDTSLVPVPFPSPGTQVEEVVGTLRGKRFHFMYESDVGPIEVYAGSPAGVYLMERVLQDMTAHPRS